MAAGSAVPTLGMAVSANVNPVPGVAVSSDGRIAATGGANRTILLRDLATHHLVCSPLAGHTDYVNTLAFSPDGGTLASGGDDATIRLWDVAHCRALGAPFSDPAGVAVESLAFSPDGSSLASAGDDTTIPLWDVATRLAIGSPLTGHTGGVWGVAFSPNGKTLVSDGTDQTLRLWDIDPTAWEQRVCRLAGRNLTHDEWAQYLGDLPYRRTCSALRAGCCSCRRRPLFDSP